MAATAYASLVSFLNTLDLIQDHPCLSNYLDQFQNESLRQMVDFFVDFLEKYSDAESREAEDLVRRIADVAHDAEDLIEVHAANRIRAGSTTKSLTVLLGLRRIIKEMNFVTAKVSKLEEGTGFITPQPTYSPMPTPPSSSAPPATAKTPTMVGFDAYLAQLMDQLIGHQSGRRIIPIVGMGGIGKTTLATNVYQNSLILHHFDVSAWVTISQQFNARDILLQALSYLGGSTSNTNIFESDDQLGVELYKVLLGRRYLIVLDDIWRVEAWEKIKFYFPENNNGSRIVVTTREAELVDYFGNSAVAVDFLDEKSSWELFCEITFAKEGCPPELEEIGMAIVKKCKGLPLAIGVFGGLLRKSPRTREYWEIITKDKSLILESGEGNIKPMSILYLSYKHLPVWLKSCFLYFGLFPDDHEIEVSQLIKLWVAEGFIRSKAEHSLEEMAESYTKDLVDRNLLLVGRLGLNKKLKSCRVHDIVREMCISIGEKENYFCVRRDITGMRQFIVDEPTARLFYPRELKTVSLFRPLILEREAPFKSKLLRVLFLDEDHLDSCSQHGNLRFLFSYNVSVRSLEYWLHSSIQLCWSLQTLIVTGSSFHAPCEIWKMPQLRHIQMQKIYLPNPPSPTCKDESLFCITYRH